MEIANWSVWQKANLCAFLIAVLAFTGVGISGVLYAMEISGYPPVPGSQKPRREIKLLLDQGKKVEAAARMKSYLALRDGTAAEYYGYGQLLVQLGRNEEAVPVFEASLVRGYPQRGLVREILAAIHLNLSSERSNPAEREAEMVKAVTNAKQAIALGRRIHPDLKKRLRL